MKKIPTLFQRDPNNMRYVTRQLNPAAAWVLAGQGRATRKYDGTCVQMDDGDNWWARREVKPGRRAPDGFVLAEHDEVTGKSVGWEPMYQSPFVKMWDEAWTAQRQAGTPIETGTYELCGPKINGNPEGFDAHVLIPHGAHPLAFAPRYFDELATYLAGLPFEGIVWHRDNGDMAKIKRRDFRDVPT